MAKQTVFPRWRGFNLLGMFASETSDYRDFRSPGYYVEEDFKMIADWGFDFVRLPLSYRVWSDASDPYTIREEQLAPLDEAVSLGEKYNLHVNIAMHRLPGYCVNTDEHPEETGRLWQGGEALDAAVYQWTEIAKRYAGIRSDRLSFNVINEPNRQISPAEYRSVCQGVIDGVRKITPDRLFILDGVNYGDTPPVYAMRHFENCGYSCRGYEPRRLTHYDGTPGCEIPIWPDSRKFDGDGERTVCDRREMEEFFGIWAALSEAMQVGVHCGEMGVHYACPHDVACRWLTDVLAILKSYNIGFALWNLRGKFGIMDNGRTDVELKSFHGHTLDEKMLKILQKY